MEPNQSRIAAFIDSLPNHGELGHTESTLLSTNMDVLGAGDNGGDCTNNDKDCYKSTNGGDCRNQSNFCADSDNGRDCVNG